MNNSRKKIIKTKNTPSTEVRNNLLYVQEIGYLPSELAEDNFITQTDSYLIMIVLKGSGHLKYNEKEYKICEGQCTYIDCRTKYSLQCDLSDPWEILWIYFNGHPAAYYYDAFINNRFNVFLPHDINNLTTLAYEIISNNIHKSRNTEIINSCLITEILTKIIILPAVHGSIESHNQQMKNILEYIDSHFTENINLDDIASTFFMNKYQITREFKKEYGETIFQHIIKQRIDYAKNLLATTDKTIEEISKICGFNDQSYFSKQFKKITGKSSLVYRKAHQ